jgi:hypothetical protein
MGKLAGAASRRREASGREVGADPRRAEGGGWSGLDPGGWRVEAAAP